jgi:hypothetical protein
MNKKLKYTTEEYIRLLKTINDRVEVLEDYQGSNVKILHKCGCGKSWYVAPSSLLSGNSKTCGLCITFAEYLVNTYGEDAIDKYWSKDNNLNPWTIPYQSNKFKVKIICQEKDYHGYYETSCASFVNGKRCPYCHPTNGICHPKDSIAQYIVDTYGLDYLNKIWDFDKNSVNPWQISKGSDKRIYLRCLEKDYHGSYNIRTADFFHGIGLCSYCGNKKVHKFDSVGYIHPKSVKLWSDKNLKTPYDFKEKSGKKVYWKCENKLHEDYKRSIHDAVLYEFRCPECVLLKKESLLQEKVRTYILNNYKYKLLHEKQCYLKPINSKTKKLLPYDNELHIDGNLLIIEVHGKQHYELAGWHITNAKKNNSSALKELEYQQWKDKFKKEYALNNNAYYLEISYLSIEDGTYKEIIDNKINSILKSNKKHDKCGCEL